ncbi:hypothetical protein [Nocardia acidivorans]|uniref:hypothetical protein n=1 Tax=Nocardia acidivorans TaxID=404580 RepID=UPI001C3FD1A1|nr:hypothetical protein [Nocardia acidivorans]
MAERHSAALDEFSARSGLSGATLARALRDLTLTGAVVPVLCGAAYRNIGVEPVLDAVVDYLPSPLDRPPVRGDGFELAADPAESLAALVFKVATARAVATHCRTPDSGVNHFTRMARV